MVTQPPSQLEDNAWIFPHGCFYSIGGGRCPFCLEIPLNGQLLWGSRGSPHNEFLGRAQALPMAEAITELCRQRLQM